ncbi:TlpA family protein disulfide reductase [Tenacibaculum geojense]|uniref:TlpA family protein disulfide reductase n=1 Tax=Tenacibaculum geojense TaxID=915352 RepID=A0ABW3JVT5_9FLAO
MKNILLSLLIIALAFTATYIIIDELEFSKRGNSNSIAVTPTNQEDSEEPSDEEFYDDEPTEKRVVHNSIDISSFITDVKTWENYYKENIDLSYDFIPLNADGEEIEKEDFLTELQTGNYIPVKLPEMEVMYQLQTFDPKLHQKISKAIKSSASLHYTYYMKEGRSFPIFDFKDLYGNEYNTENTLGKITVIKCWFINCKVCVEEFPKLNELFDRYEGYEDLVFFSLAFDEPNKLRKFLAKKPFRYPVIAKQKDFMNDQIGVKQYPTHIILDEYGNVLKMVNNVDSLITTLDEIMNGGQIADLMTH